MLSNQSSIIDKRKALTNDVINCENRSVVDCIRSCRLFALSSAHCIQISLQQSISVCFSCFNFYFSFRWSRILTLLTSSQSAAEFEAASEDLLDDSLIDWMEMVFGSKTGLAAAGPRTILTTSSLGASLNEANPNSGA